MPIKETRPCKGCGMPLVFFANAKGAVLPLQAVKNVYYLDKDEDEAVIAAVLGSVTADIYVSHFETCPNPPKKED